MLLEPLGKLHVDRTKIERIIEVWHLKPHVGIHNRLIFHCFQESSCASLMQDISMQGHKEDGGPWRIDEAFQTASKEFNSSANLISKNCLIMVNGENPTNRDSPALFGDVAVTKTESSNEDNQGVDFVSVICMEWGSTNCMLGLHDVDVAHAVLL